MEAMCAVHRCRFDSAFAYFYRQELTYFQLKYALMSAMLRLSPTKKVFTFSLSSRVFATLATTSLALAIC